MELYWKLAAGVHTDDDFPRFPVFVVVIEHSRLRFSYIFFDLPSFWVNNYVSQCISQSVVIQLIIVYYLQAKTGIQNRSNNPMYCEEISMVEMFPNADQVIRLEVCAVEGLFNRTIAVTDLQLTLISHDGDNGTNSCYQNDSNLVRKKYEIRNFQSKRGLSPRPSCSYQLRCEVSRLLPPARYICFNQRQFAMSEHQL